MNVSAPKSFESLCTFTHKLERKMQDRHVEKMMSLFAEIEFTMTSRCVCMRACMHA